MGRTRGASSAYDNEGAVLGKGGVPIHPSGQPMPVALDRDGTPISPAAALLTQPRNMPGRLVLHGPGAEAVPEPLAILGYRADKTTWARDMDGWELARLLDLAFRRDAEGLADGFVVRLTVDEFAALDGNMRRHFMAVRG